MRPAPADPNSSACLSAAASLELESDLVEQLNAATNQMRLTEPVNWGYHAELGYYASSAR